MDRRTLLKALIKDAFDGSQAEFARAIKKSTAQVNQWVSGYRALGDAGARHIEITLNLGQGYFDGGQRSCSTIAPNQKEDALLGYFRVLSEKDKDEVIRELQEKERLAVESALRLSPAQLEALLRQRRIA